MTIDDHKSDRGFVAHQVLGMFSVTVDDQNDPSLTTGNVPTRQVMHLTQSAGLAGATCWSGSAGARHTSLPGRLHLYEAYGKRAAHPRNRRRNDGSRSFRSRVVAMVQPIRKALFPVAGLGTRSLPATKAIPKEMLPIVDKPLIQYAVEEAQEAGIEQFVFVTGRGKSALEDHFDHAIELEQTLAARHKKEELEAVLGCKPAPGQLSYVRQQTPLGLGHAVWCGRHLIGDEPFAVLLPDDLIKAQPGCLKQMIEVYNDTAGNIVAVEDVPREHTNRYGILDVESDDGILARARGLVEKPSPEKAPSTLSIIGRYILQPEIFDELDRHEKGAGGEIQLTDAMARTIDRIPFHGLRFEGQRFDCGNKIGFLHANLAFALSRDDTREQTRQIMNDLTT